MCISCTLKEKLKIWQSGMESPAAQFLRKLFVIPSGPDEKEDLRFRSA